MIASVRRAWAGVRRAIRGERNLRIQICVGAYVVLFAALAGLELWAWGVCFVCIGMVLCAELINTAVERLCDKVCIEYDELIRFSKDAAAGGVLLAAALSAAAGAVVFFRFETLERLWTLFVRHPWLMALPPLLLLPCIFFVKGSRMGAEEKTWKSSERDSSRC